MDGHRIDAQSPESIYPEAVRVFTEAAEHVADHGLSSFAVGWLERLAVFLSDERLGEATRAVLAVIAERTRAGEPQ